MVSDILMVLAWCAAVATASCDIQLAKYGALDPGVKSTLEGFKGTDEEMARTLKVRHPATLGQRVMSTNHNACVAFLAEHVSFPVDAVVE